MIFINLPVADVAAARAFYEALGFSVNEAFSNDDAVSIVIDEHIVFMLLSEARFGDFITGPIAPRDSTEVLVALSCDSREEVDRLADAAIMAGGAPWMDAQDHGFMYGRSFRDLDAHVVELMWMDPAAAAAGPEAFADNAA